jgi:hypothetical protein
MRARADTPGATPVRAILMVDSLVEISVDTAPTLVSVPAHGSTLVLRDGKPKRGNAHVHFRQNQVRAPA